MERGYNMTNFCPECGTPLYKRTPMQVSHHRYTRQNSSKYDFQRLPQTTQNLFGASFVVFDLPYSWSDSTIQSYYQNLLMNVIKRNRMTRKNVASEKMKSVGVESVTPNLPTINNSKSINIRVYEQSRRIKLISVGISGGYTMDQGKKFAQVLIDHLFQTHATQGSIESLEQVDHFVKSVSSCVFCELFDLARALSWKSGEGCAGIAKDNNKIHYHSLEVLYQLQAFTMPTVAIKKRVMKEIVQTEKKLVSFRGDLDAVLKVRAGIRPSIYGATSDNSSANCASKPQELLTRKAFADLYISIYMGLGGPRCDFSGLSNLFSSAQISRTPPCHAFVQEDANAQRGEFIAQPTVEDKRMWQGASVQATRLQKGSFLGTCPVRFLSSLYKKMSPFNMFFKQTLLLSLKRQQFASLSSKEIYEVLSMIPELFCIRTYTVLMLKEFCKVKNNDDTSLSEVQFLSCFLACCYSSEYERLGLLSDGFGLENLRIDNNNDEKLAKLSLASDCRVFMYWLNNGFSTSKEKIDMKSFLYEFIKQCVIFHDAYMIGVHLFRLAFRHLRKKGSKSSCCYRWKRILYYSINVFVMINAYIAIALYVYNPSDYLGKHIATLEFCTKVGGVRGLQLLVFLLIFSFIRAVEIVHANNLLQPGDVDQHRLYRALKYSKVKMAIYGKNAHETMDTGRLLNEYILDRSVSEQRSRATQSNYYLEYISMAYVSTGSVSRLVLGCWRAIMLVFLVLIVSQSFRPAMEANCTSPLLVMYTCAVCISYFMIGSVALNIFVETCSIRLSLVRFKAMTDPFHALRKTRKGGTYRKDAKYVKFPGYVPLSNLHNCIEWIKLRKFLVLNIKQRFRAILRRASVLLLVIFFTGGIRAVRFYLTNKDIIGSNMHGDNILSYATLFLMCPLAFFVLESSLINDELESHDTLISRNIYRCEERRRMLSIRTHRGRDEVKTLRQRSPAHPSVGFAIDGSKNGSNHDKMQVFDIDTMDETIKLLKATLANLRLRRDKVKIFGIAMTQELLLLAGITGISALPNVFKYLVAGTD